MIGRYRLGQYLTGATAARTGDELSGPALLLLGLAVTGSVATAALLLAALTVSAALGGPLLGALLDRSPRPGRLLAMALAAYATGLALILLGTGTVPVQVVVTVAVVTGLLNPALSGGWTAQLPAVVRPERFARANALDALTFGAASLTGPALAGLIGGLAGAPAAMVVAIVLIAAAIPVAVRLPGSGSPAPRARTSLIADLRAGAVAIGSSRTLRAATAASTVSFAGMGMLVVCVPLLGARDFGDANRGALLLSVLAAAALGANALLARSPSLLSPDTIVLASTLVIGVGVLWAAQAGGAFAAVAAVVVVGIGEGPQLTALFAIRHREAPEGLRSQIFTTGASVKITGFAAGSALAGPLAARSVGTCLLVATFVELAAALVFLACRGRAEGAQKAQKVQKA
ncbi:MFS transporter [Amycolatopsis palatopharyngis]|uniref:MFS transporter n=1 Tax=Amycolatopsis palatopharyngis TaxID=187982 RepID=UPI000E277E4A|nr:MFS transporter [Amycolatopsis palatopharyngis]